MSTTGTVKHPFPPVWAPDSLVLILGSMPSVKSREQGFYYGHPRNRFWKVLAALMHEEEPADPQARRNFLLRHKIALWDVMQSCRIAGSQDSSIREAVPNKLSGILRNSRIRAIFANGQTAGRFYRKSCQSETGWACHILPSTSPANNRYTLAELCSLWQPVRDSLAESGAETF